jgi:hypothetical protein
MIVWFCHTCGQRTLRKKARRHVWCSTCKRLSLANGNAMDWYEAETNRLLAGRKLPDDPKV